MIANFSAEVHKEIKSSRKSACFSHNESLCHFETPLKSLCKSWEELSIIIVLTYCSMESGVYKHNCVK
jgi:hypothetical protein